MFRHKSRRRRYSKRQKGAFGAFIFSILVSMGVISQSPTADVELSWTNPTEREDGTNLPSSEIATFTVDCSNGKSHTGAATSSTHTFTYNRVTEAGSKSCSLFVTDTEGRVSSAVTASFEIDSFIFGPKAPTGFGATVTNS